MPHLFKALPPKLKTIGVKTIFTGPYCVDVPNYGVHTHAVFPIWGKYEVEDVFRFYMLWKAFDVLKKKEGSVTEHGVTKVPEITAEDVVLPLFAIRPGDIAATTSALELD